MNKKYPEVKGYWVYSIQIKSNGKYYIGVSRSKKCSKRWNKASYKSCSLNQYLDEWESMKKTVLVDNLSSKEEALKMEDNIIRALQMNDLCINELRSGLITSDKNAYKRELRKNNPEYREREYQRSKQRVKQWRKDNKEKWKEYQREWQKQNRLKKKLKNN